jgi:hypothetical protein
MSYPSRASLLAAVRRQKPPPLLDATLMRHPLKWIRNQSSGGRRRLRPLPHRHVDRGGSLPRGFPDDPGAKYDWDHALTGGPQFLGLHVQLALLSKATWAEWRHSLERSRQRRAPRCQLPRNSESGTDPMLGGGPACRHKRASGACRSLANAPVQSSSRRREPISLPTRCRTQTPRPNPRCSYRPEGVARPAASGTTASPLKQSSHGAPGPPAPRAWKRPRPGGRRRCRSWR